MRGLLSGWWGTCTQQVTSCLSKGIRRSCAPGFALAALPALPNACTRRRAGPRRSHEVILNATRLRARRCSWRCACAGSEPVPAAGDAVAAAGPPDTAAAAPRESAPSASGLPQGIVEPQVRGPLPQQFERKPMQHRPHGGRMHPTGVSAQPIHCTTCSGAGLLSAHACAQC